MSLLSHKDSLEIGFVVLNAQVDVVYHTWYGIGAEVVEAGEGYGFLPVHLQPVERIVHYDFNKLLGIGFENVLYGRDEDKIQFIESFNLNDERSIPFHIPTTDPNALFPETTANIRISFPSEKDGNRFVAFYSLPPSCSQSDLKFPDKYTVDTGLRLNGSPSSIDIGMMMNDFVRMPEIFKVDLGPNDHGGRVYGIVLAAKYQRGYFVTIKSDVSSSLDVRIFVKVGDSIELPTYDDTATSCFVGWADNSREIYTGVITPTKDLTLWSVYGYRITFDANGGVVDAPPRIILQNQRIGALPLPSRYGYYFVGWFTQDGRPVSENTQLYGNQTIYAHWVEIPEPGPGPVPGPSPEPEPEPGVVRRFIAMVKLLFKPLPHKVGTADIKSPELKKVTMQFMENFKFIERQMNNIMNAVVELQKKGG